MQYDSKRQVFLVADEDSKKTKMTFSQLQQIVRLATVEAVCGKVTFPFALYDCLYRWDRKQAIAFLATGVSDEFFAANREKALQLVGGFYYNHQGSQIV